MIELLAPAGSYDSLRAAVNAGADAVYIGGSRFGARAYADNPGEDELILGIHYCHLYGRKLYMTVNTLLKDPEMEKELYEFMVPYDRAGLDGVIVQDFGVVRFLRKHFPDLEVHASTQMTITGVDAVRLLQREGITRVVPARELSLAEIETIIKDTGIEVESFIHGAMCYSYSGQCLFSSMLGGRSGNRGRCAQPCRLPYQLTDQKGQLLSAKKPYLLSMKDMNTLEQLPLLLDAGIVSLKIEGRMKRPEYTAGVVRVYRKYMDRYLKKGGTNWYVESSDLSELMDLYNRGGFSAGYYKQHNGPAMMALQRPNHQGTQAAHVQFQHSKTPGVITDEALYKGDILEMEGMSHDYTLPSDFKKGDSIVIPDTRVKLREGAIWYRTKNQHLLQELQSEYLLKNPKLNIKGVLRIKTGKPAILELYYDKIHIQAKTPEPVSAAVSSPASEETIRKQLMKTGNTPFTFSTLSIEMNEPVFLPVGQLNTLRRTSLDLLQQEILAQYERCTAIAEPAGDHTAASDADEESRPESFLSVLVTSGAQLVSVLNLQSTHIKRIYLDLLVGGMKNGRFDARRLLEAVLQVKKADLDCFIDMPPVFRKQDRSLFCTPDFARIRREADGYLIHTLDQLAFLQTEEPEARLIADETLYAYNQEAVEFLRQHGICQLTLPAELNYHELRQLHQKDSELTVYGRQALMQSAQCLLKNTVGCTKTPQITWLHDRKQAAFPVMNRCMNCCSTIYNSIPLSLLDCRKEIESLHPASLRLTFITESAKETMELLSAFECSFFAAQTEANVNGQNQIERTRGHFRRGVE